MKKLNYDEILDILKENTTVQEFCDEDLFLEIPENFKFSEEVQAKVDACNKARKEWELNGKSYKSDDPFYREMRLNNMPYQEKFDEYSNHLGLGKVEKVESYGGEDCGSTYYAVNYFKDHDVYIKVSGWYQSHYGTDFEDWDSACEEVKPKTKTITVYE